MLLELPDARFNAAGSPGEVLPMVKQYKTSYFRAGEEMLRPKRS